MSSTDNPSRSVHWSRDTRRFCAPERRRVSAHSACRSPDSHGKAERPISAPAMTAHTSSLCLSEAGDCMDGKPLMTGSVQGPRRWRRQEALVQSCRKDSQHTPVLGTSDVGRLGANRPPKTELQQGHPRFHGWSRSPHNNYLWDPWSTCRSFPDSFTCIRLLYGVYVYFFLSSHRTIKAGNYFSTLPLLLLAASVTRDYIYPHKNCTVDQCATYSGIPMHVNGIKEWAFLALFLDV